MVYNSKLSGALLVLAFLACLFVVSSAENIREQPLNVTALEGGLKESPNYMFRNGILLRSMYRNKGPRNPRYCAYKFVEVEDHICKVPFSKQVTCLVQHANGGESCPKVLSPQVKVILRKTEGKKIGYELQMSSVQIEGFAKKFKSKVVRVKIGEDYIYEDTDDLVVVDKFNEYSLMVYPRV
eukprot:Nk52_evm12s48 gene=Nk52_evmTU12s48